MMLSANQNIGPQRATSNLGLIAVLLHKYFGELLPEETDDVSLMIHELFTRWLPSEWQTHDKRTELYESILNVARRNDLSFNTKQDEDYYRVLIKKWLDLE